jgi:POT family proton-dependent oligopeptide transporter
MIVANGFFKSNISSTLGLLYGNDNDKKDSAVTIFYMGINLGAFFSPLVCGTLAVKFGYEYGFAAAGIGMLIGLILYKVFEKIFVKKIPSLYTALVISMLGGRVVNALVKSAVLGLSGSEFSLFVIFLELFTGTWAGILLQLVIIPPLVVVLEKFVIARKS